VTPEQRQKWAAWEAEHDKEQRAKVGDAARGRTAKKPHAAKPTKAALPIDRTGTKPEAQTSDAAE
jgi:hypothetical protein